MLELEKFLELNNIDTGELFEALHMDIREVILKIVCEKLKKDEHFFAWAKRVFFSTNNIDATKKVVARACDCKLSEGDTLWMKDCIKAFFAKNASRQVITQEEKERLLKKQGNKCAICGCEISLQEMHVDHIIPFDYVGDRLNDNYQGLCKDCNLSKSNHVAITVTNLITHRRLKDEKSLFDKGTAV